MGKKVAVKFPKTLGATLDMLWEVRAKRLTAQKVVDKIGETENAIEQHLLEKFKKADLDGARGGLCSATVEIRPVPTIADFDKVWAHAVKTDSPELFQRRLSVKACRERWEAGVAIPGVSKFDKVELSLHKARAK